jgi:hypothetical protein
MRACDAAVEVLQETGNSALMWGDGGLLHLIADKLGWKHNAWHTEERVLRALARTPGPLAKRKTLCAGHWVLYFAANKS